MTMNSINPTSTIAAAMTGSIIPAGPSPLFFIRHSAALTDPNQILDVFKSIVTKWGPISSSPSGVFSRTYFVADHDVVNHIFCAHDAFGKYPFPTSDITRLQALIGKGMLATHTDKEWAAHRKTMARAFSRSSVVSNFSTIIHRHCRSLLEIIDDGTSNPIRCNISELAMLLSGRVMNDILAPGNQFSDENIMTIKDRLDRSILDFHRWNFKWRAKAHKRALEAQMEHLMETAAASPLENGLIQKMMQEEPDWERNSAARERLMGRLLNLLVAGFETTATTLNWVFYHLADNPALQEEIRREVSDISVETLPELNSLPLLKSLILEAMRLHPVLWFNIRYALKDVTVDGYRFKKNSRVMMLPFVVNRCAKKYTSPDSFDNTRYDRGEPEPVFPFGNGPRVCIGRSLAELEMVGLVAHFLQRFALKPNTRPKQIGGVLLQPDQDVFIDLVRI